LDFTDATATIVNFNTPGLLSNCVKSIRQFYEIPIIVIDGSSEEKHQVMRDMIDGTKNLEVCRFEHNIFHGPGLKLGMERTTTRYALLMDSDATMIKKGFLELCAKRMDEYTYGAGLVMELKFGIKYLHPYCCLLNMRVASKYSPPINHGAPMIRIMKEIKEKKENKLVDIFEISNFVHHQWKGTRGQGTWPRR
jgi:hypothetical protein